MTVDRKAASSLGQRVEEAIDTSIDQAEKVISQSSSIMDMAIENFKRTSRKAEELRQKIRQGARRTNGDGSFLL